MKKKLLFFLVITLCLVGCNKQKATHTEPLKPKIIKSGLRFCEGTLPYNGALLISNFGTDNLFPLNKEGKGYIMKYDGKTTSTFIAADGCLNAPKGMAFKKDYLFIADVDQMVVYNTNDLSKTPQIVSFPQGNSFVNDIVIEEKWAYISVTNTGKVFRLDISDLDNLAAVSLEEYAEIEGANGLVLDGKQLYIASYPADGVTKDANVIYVISDINAPKVEKLITRPGQYDGLALRKGRLYFTDWQGGKIGYVSIRTKEIEYMAIEGMPLVGAADISIMKDSLYIPMLTASELLVVGL